MLQQSGKYLYLSYEYDGGLDSKIYDLDLLIKVSLSLRRIPIIKEAKTSSNHRLDDINQDVSIDWDRYINLSGAGILKTEFDGTIKELPDTLQYVYERDFDFNAYPENQIRYINGLQLYDEENEHYPIIFMSRSPKSLERKRRSVRLPKFLTIPLSHALHTWRRKRVKKSPSFGEGLYFCPRLNAYFQSSFYIIIPPSSEVNELSDIVINYFGTSRENMKLFSNILYELPRFRNFDVDRDFNNFHHYACMHVRFGFSQSETDKMIKRHEYLRQDIEKIVAKMYEVHSRNMPLYIMSNIVDADHFDFLKSKYNVYRYTDFKKLVKQVTRQGIVDHNLLFAVERNILKHASVKILPHQRNRFVFEGPWTWHPNYVHKE